MSKLAPPPLAARGLLKVAVGLIILLAIYVIMRGGGESPRAAAPDTRRPDGHWKAVARGQHYLDIGRPDLALKSVMHIRDDRPGAGEAMAVAGAALFRLGDSNGARNALEVALNFQPNQPEAALALASLYLQRGDTARGLANLEKAAQGAPDDFRPWLEMGKIHHDLGQSNRAAEAFEEVVRRAPNLAEPRIGLITSLLNSAQIEQATPRIAEALESHPDDSAILGLAARHAFELGRLEQTLDFAERSLERDPDNVEALLARAQVHHATGTLEPALVDLERVVAMRPNHLGALQLLGKVETRLGLTDRAAETIARHRHAHERALRMNELSEDIVTRPDDPGLRWEMGKLAMEGGSTVLARRCFEAALLIDSQYRPALESLATLKASTTDDAGPPLHPAADHQPAAPVP